MSPALPPVTDTGGIAAAVAVPATAKIGPDDSTVVGVLTVQPVITTGTGQAGVTVSSPAASQVMLNGPPEDDVSTPKSTQPSSALVASVPVES